MTIESTNLPLTEELVIDKIQSVDWYYEFSEDVRRQKRGQLEMEQLESIVFEYWKDNPEKAVELWNTYSPVRANDKTTVPFFIIQLQNKK